MDKELQTPYFVIDETILQQYYDMLTTSLSENWGRYIVGYSFKTNSLPWLVNFVKINGAYAEVVSQDEYQLAKYMGFGDNEIIYNGPYKGKESFIAVLNAGGYVNIDSMQEIGWLEELARNNSEKDYKVGVRVNFDLEKMCPGETTMGKESGRFGFCYETGKFSQAVSIINQMSNVSIVGLHLHSSSKSRSVDIFKSIALMACKLKNEYAFKLEYIDLGGGYCGGMEGRPEYPDYFPAVAEILRNDFNPEEITLIVEPGISLISKCTKFVTKVFDVRDIKGTRYVMTDGSRFNIDPTMIKSSHIYQINYCDDDKRDILDEQVISGFTCMEVDRLLHMKKNKELVPGDFIIYENVGGYTMSLNPLFIQYFPAVYVNTDNTMKIVRKKWTPEEYVQGSKW